MRSILRHVPAICLLAGLLWASVSDAADAVWDAEFGWINLSEKPAETAKAKFRHASGLFVGGRYAAALEMFQNVCERFPDSPQAGPAAFRVAELQLRLKRSRRALATTNRLLADLPKGVSRERVIALQLEIAEAINEGTASLGAQTFAEVAESARTPEHEFAARMGQGGALFRREEFAAAADAYKAAVSAWPEAPEAKNALYRAALSDLRECREEEGDDARLREAHDNFIAFGVRAPGDPRAETAAGMASAIESALGEKNPKKRRIYYGLTYHVEGNYKKAERIFRKGAKPSGGAFREIVQRNRGAGLEGVSMAPHAGYSRGWVGEEAAGVAHYHWGESLFERGKHRAAFDVLTGFLKGYPDSLNRRKAVNILMEIAEEAMGEDKCRFPLDVLRTITEQDPTGPLADDAFMFIGRLELDRKNFAEASAAFRAVTEEYPRSEWAYAALYHAGLSELRGSEYSQDNEHLLDEARRAFEVCLADRPNGAFADEAAKLLGECRARQADKLLEIAEFYRRQREYRSAALYCRLVLDEHPKSEAAGAARRMLSEYGEGKDKAP